MPDRALTSSRTQARPMPSKPTGFHRLPEILDVLRSMDASHLDRQGVETLFGVGPRESLNAAEPPGRADWYKCTQMSDTE